MRQRYLGCTLVEGSRRLGDFHLSQLRNWRCMSGALAEAGFQNSFPVASSELTMALHLGPKWILGHFQYLETFLKLYF